ncbi:unnamed protein product [Adineta steineri]|uniref:RTA1-like protein n=1 Tax=Adineta steineri TaxID=433720 RepID=A0A814D3H4_9BILA|nr:unnamed protein product [Adineta steineri]CAF3992262.1 unnamed protein product [Adineta steineri]
MNTTTSTLMSSTAINYANTFFRYDPSIAGASIFLAMFSIVTIVHIYQMFRYKTYYYIAIVICGIAEVVGYATRLVSRANPFNKDIYSTQYALIVLAPIFLVASLYVMLGRIIRFVGHRSLIPAKRIALIFITGDVITFLVQIFGAIMLLNKSNASNVNLGKNILLVGLIIQIGVFFFFTICAIHFHVTVNKSGQHNGGNWRQLIKALYVACVFVLLRSLFRVIEFSESVTGYLQTTEWTFYVFDALLIFLTTTIFTIYHPGKYLAQNSIQPVNDANITNRIEPINMPKKPAESAKPKNSIDNIELA